MYIEKKKKINKQRCSERTSKVGWGNSKNNNYQKFNTARRKPEEKKTENLKKHYFYSFDTLNCKCKALTIKTSNSKTLSIEARCDFYSNLSFLLTAAGNRTKYLLQRGKLRFGSKSLIILEGFHYTTDLLHCRSVKKTPAP